jgi:Flp pilus assembly protein CpaB
MNRYQLGISAGLALLGTLLLALYLRRVENEVSGGPPVPLLVARASLARGAVIADAMLAVRDVPSAYVDGRAVRASELEHVLGLRLAGALGATDTLLWSDLAIGEESRGLSALVQPGKLAHSVRVGGTGASQLIRPGDYVDVFAGAALLLQRVMVLAVGTNTQRDGWSGDDTQRDGWSGDDAHLLTFSLDPEQTHLLKSNESRGITAGVRSADDDHVILDLPPPGSRSPVVQKPHGPLPLQ